MTMTFNLNHKKLSNQWSQLFAECLTPQETPQETEVESPEALHAFMQEKLAAQQAKH